MSKRREIHLLTPARGPRGVEAFCGRWVWPAFTTVLPWCVTCKHCEARIASCQKGGAR